MHTSFQELNEAQQRAVTMPQEPLLIVAGAGTGKTKTLTSRIAHLIDQGVPAYQIYALTFTNKAAKEMLDRVATGRSLHRLPHISTFHSLGARLLREEAQHLGRTARFTIYDESDSMQLVRTVLKGIPGASRAGRGPAFFRSALSTLKNASTTEGADDAFGADGALVRRVYEAYEDSLRSNDAFDFDDLLHKSVDVLTTHPEVCAKWRNRVSYLFVDEYQDVNDVQYALIRLLVGDTGRISVVGDDHQTIYSWRGSNIGIFLRFEEDWPGAHVILLEQNYRSTQTILNAANALIAHNKHQKPKTLFTTNEVGASIVLAELGSEYEEAAWIAEQVGVRRDDVPTAIIYRTNAQSRALETALITYGVPYRLFGGVQFYDRREIRDVMAGIRITANPHDTVSVDRLRKAFRKAVWTNVVTSMRAASPDTPTHELISRFLRVSEYEAYLEAHFENAAERLENIAELLRFSVNVTDLYAFLEQTSLVQSTDTPASARGAQHPLILMTMHMAKGLEFDRVHIAGVNEGILPHTRSLDTLDELEEERRLLYVGMTRARRTLSMSFSGVPSRFLFEIPEEYTTLTGTPGMRRDLPLDDEERYIDVHW